MNIQTAGSPNPYFNQLRMLVAGQSGAGKTRFAATFPNPIWADCRGGLMSVADKGVKSVKITCEADLLELRLTLDALSKEREERFGFPVDTLVLDTVDEFQRTLLAERLIHEKRAETTASDYGWLGQRLHTIFESLMDLPVHVVVLSHLKDVTDGDGGQLFVKPGLAGAFADQIHQYVDYSLLIQNRHWSSAPQFMEEMGQQGAIEVPGDHTQFTFLRTYSDKIYEWVKDASGTLPPEFDVNFEDDYTRIKALVTAKIATLPPSGDLTIKLPSDEENKLKRKIGSTDHHIAETVRETKKKSAKITVAAEPADRVATATFEGTATDVKCTDCEKKVENEDRLDLSMIRYREPLCGECFSRRLQDA
jgi:hypothetical protein